MDIWHTAEPERMATDGWLGRTIRELDPNKDNVLTGVNFGRGLPRAMAAPGVSVASVGNLETYGVLTGIQAEDQRVEALDIFARMYSPMIGTGPVSEYLSQTGLDALKGADILSTAPANYSSSIEYGGSPFAQWLKNVAQVHLAGFGTRILYTGLNPGAFDTHANQNTAMPALWRDVSNAISDFYHDLVEHDASEEVVTLVFTEFGRRVKGERFRHRPWCRRSRLRNRRCSQGRPLRRIPLSGAGQARRRRPPVEQRLPQHLRHPPRTVDGHRLPRHSRRHV